MRALAWDGLWQPGTRLDSWMYRIAQNIWLDRMRARRVRGECIALEAAAAISGTDGRNVVENRLSLAAVAGAMAMLVASSDRIHRPRRTAAKA